MNLLDYSIIGLYLLGLLVLGFVLKQQRNKQDYFLGGRQLGWKPLSLSIMATQLSAVSFISAPAFVGLRDNGGLIWLSYELALPLAMLLLLWKILPALHRAGVISVYDFLEQRYARSTRLLISAVFQISRSFATAIMIYAVSIILQGSIGLAYWQSILAIGVITLIYSLQGGMKAVVYGDAIQMVIIIIGALTCLGFGLYHLGGVDVLLQLVEPSRLQTIDFSSSGFDGSGFGFLPMVFGGIVLYASYYGCDQSEAQRSLSAKNPQELKLMIMTASLLRFPITLIYCSAGLVIGTLALSTPDFLSQIPADKPDWLMPIFIVNYLPNGVIGLLLVAILAAAMSSLSSAINSLSAVTVEDICRIRHRTLSDNQYMAYAKYAGGFWGIVTLLLSFYAGDIAPTVIEAINKIGSVFYGPILACFLVGIMDKRINAKHMNAGIALGVFVNVCLWLFFPQVFWFWWNLTGFVVATAASYLLLSVTGASVPVEADKSVTPYQVIRGKESSVLLGWFGFVVIACLGLSYWLTSVG